MMSKIFKVYYKFANFYFENLLNVKTRGVIDTFKLDGYEYATISYVSIFKILRYLNLNSSDCLVDIGCGKGRVVCCAATMDLKEVSGIEFDQSLANIARENLLRLRGRRTVTHILQCAAEDQTYDRATVIYLYNPFGEETLIKFLQALTNNSMKLSNRRIIYVNPKHRHVFGDFGYEVSDHWKQHDGILEHEVLFYEFVKH